MAEAECQGRFKSFGFELFQLEGVIVSYKITEPLLALSLVDRCVYWEYVNTVVTF